MAFCFYMKVEGWLQGISRIVAQWFHSNADGTCHTRNIIHTKHNQLNTFNSQAYIAYRYVQLHGYYVSSGHQSTGAYPYVESAVLAKHQLGFKTLEVVVLILQHIHVSALFNLFREQNTLKLIDISLAVGLPRLPFLAFGVFIGCCNQYVSG